MTEKQLKKLSRTDLLELLVAQTKRAEALEEELKILKEQLANKEIKINNSGSIAEASLKLNGVFESAQAAAEQYLENIRSMSGDQKSLCEQMEAESRKKADELLRLTEEKCASMIHEAEAYWGILAQRLEKFYDEHLGLRELIQSGQQRMDAQKKQHTSKPNLFQL